MKNKNIFRILHTADWHLGKTLNDQSRDKEHALFLDWLLKTIRDHKIDLLIVAGDVFDSANPPQSAQSQYYNFVSTLYRQGGCSLVAIAGNHDSPAQLEAPRQIMRALSAHVIGFLPESPESRLLPLPDPDHPCCVIAALPYLRDRDLRTGTPGQNAAEIQQALVSGITRRYAETAEAAHRWHEQNVPVLATGHLTVVGASHSDSEREIHIGGLGAIHSDVFPETFSYVALGHLHRPQATDVLGRVQYAGSPLPLSFSEAKDTKEVRLLEFADGALQAQWGLQIPVFRRLVQMRTTRDDLAKTMREFEPESKDLETWVEVVVTGAGFSEDLNALVREHIEGQAFTVLKILREGTSDLQGMRVDDQSDAELIETLLDDPLQVFRHRLNEEEGLSEEDRQKLELAFAQLLEKHQTATEEP